MLLDGDAAGASWREIMPIAFNVDQDINPPRHKRRIDTHLARAHWMTREDYRHLLDSRR